MNDLQIKCVWVNEWVMSEWLSLAAFYRWNTKVFKYRSILKFACTIKSSLKYVNFQLQMIIVSLHYRSEAHFKNRDAILPNLEFPL